MGTTLTSRVFDDQGRLAPEKDIGIAIGKLISLSRSLSDNTGHYEVQRIPTRNRATPVTF